MHHTVGLEDTVEDYLQFRYGIVKEINHKFNNYGHLLRKQNIADKATFSVWSWSSFASINS